MGIRKNNQNNDDFNKDEEITLNADGSLSKEAEEKLKARKEKERAEAENKYKKMDDVLEVELNDPEEGDGKPGAEAKPEQTSDQGDDAQAGGDNQAKEAKTTADGQTKEQVNVFERTGNKEQDAENIAKAALKKNANKKEAVSGISEKVKEQSEAASKHSMLRQSYHGMLRVLGYLTKFIVNFFCRLFGLEAKQADKEKKDAQEAVQDMQKKAGMDAEQADKQALDEVEGEDFAANLNAFNSMVNDLKKTAETPRATKLNPNKPSAAANAYNKAKQELKDSLVSLHNGYMNKSNDQQNSNDQIHKNSFGPGQSVSEQALFAAIEVIMKSIDNQKILDGAKSSFDLLKNYANSVDINKNIREFSDLVKEDLNQNVNMDEIELAKISQFVSSSYYFKPTLSNLSNTQTELKNLFGLNDDQATEIMNSFKNTAEKNPSICNNFVIAFTVRAAEADLFKDDEGQEPLFKNRFFDENAQDDDSDFDHGADRMGMA